VRGYLGDEYLHDGNTNDGLQTVTFSPRIPQTGVFEVRISYTHSTNRAARAPITVYCADFEKTVYVDQRKKPAIGGVFHSLGQFRFEQGSDGHITIGNKDARGHVIADAVQLIPVEELVAQKKQNSDPSAKNKQNNKKDTETAKKREALKDLEKTLADVKKNAPPPSPIVMSVREEDTIEDCFICIRGNVHNQGEVVPRGVLQIVNHEKPLKISSKQSGRLEMARWIASADNTLTSRVMVNRIWLHLFGEGLVRTPDNLGATGEQPTQPELLDYLAVKFVEDGWSIKRTIKRIVLSRTYQLTSKAPTNSADPENRWLSRANRRRLDAETIRDSILTVGGQIDLKYQGNNIPASAASEFGYKFTSLRRSVYVPSFRNTLHGLFEVFDFANPNLVTGHRNTSTLSTQALYMMNSPFVMDQARHAAQRLLDEPNLNSSERIKLAYQRALGREPTSVEFELSLDFLNRPTDANSADKLDDWANFCQTLFSCIDFRYVD